MADYATARRNMVDCQVRPSDVTDLRVIDALLAVPREAFVPDARKPLAYLDLDLNVAQPNTPQRALMRPALLGQLLQAAAITPGDSVLVVGCASGYPAAVAGLLAARVAATESDPSLAEQARTALAHRDNVAITAANPAEGRMADGPFDVILVHGASEIGFSFLRAQLKSGGRLVGIDASVASDRAVVITRSGDDFGDRVLCDATAPVLPGFERPPAFVF